MLGRCPNVPAASKLGDHSYVTHLEVDDVDEFDGRAVAAGVEVLEAPDRIRARLRSRRPNRFKRDCCWALARDCCHESR